MKRHATAKRVPAWQPYIFGAAIVIGLALFTVSFLKAIDLALWTWGSVR